MRKTLLTLAMLSLAAPVLWAAPEGDAQKPAAPDPSREPTAQVMRGARMKLLPPKPNILDSEDPLGDITNEMSDIVGELADLKTGRPTQGKQGEVASQLDTLIEELEKQCKGGGSGGSRNPTKPMNRSQIASGPGGMGELINPKSGSRNFGNLPPRERNAILQSKTEGFPPGYESLLQSYYQRLAQEKSTGDEAAPGAAPVSPSPTTRPAGK